MSSAADVLDQSQKSFSKLLADGAKKSDAQTAKTSPAGKDDGKSSDAKRVANAYAAYDAFKADAPGTKAAA